MKVKQIRAFINIIKGFLISSDLYVGKNKFLATKLIVTLQHFQFCFIIRDCAFRGSKRTSTNCVAL